jgi:hypothetical protein
VSVMPTQHFLMPVIPNLCLSDTPVIPEFQRFLLDFSSNDSFQFFIRFLLDELSATIHANSGLAIPDETRSEACLEF